MGIIWYFAAWIPACADTVRLFMLNKKRIKKQEDEVN
jgi:hypothetical protein